MAEILKYRTQLMAVAIFGVMACHLMQLYPIVPWIRFGSIGVEIFFFLSGMGMVFSYRRNSGIACFYGRRALRILPSYYIVLLLAAAISGWQLINWTNILLLGTFRWFIGTICLFYLLFPLYMACCKRVPPYVVYAAVCCLVAVCFLYLQPWIPMRWFARAPVFFLGCLCVQSERILSHRAAWVLVAVPSLFLFGLCHMQRELYEGIGLLALFRTLFTPGCCIVLVWLFARCEQTAWGRLPMACMSAFGVLTLEIYLLDDIVREQVNLYLGTSCWPLQFVLIYPLAYAVNWLGKRIQGLFKRKAAQRPAAQ